MSTIVTRAGNGAPLTNTQVDDNFTNLNTDKLEINAALGTPASVTLTNATGLPTAGLVDNAVTDAKLRDSAGLSVIGRGANSTGDPADIVAGTNHQVLRRDGSSLAFGAVDLSSNQAVTGTLPVNQGGTGITSFGSGIATWLGTPSSANLAAAVTDETGTGALVFANSPTLVTPALGTPASGVVTNLTGTASININGTVGATTPAAGAFTTLSATSPATFEAGTAALPAITTSGDTNTGLFFPAPDTIAFSEGGAEAMRIDSSGNVGIGTTDPTSQLTIGSGGTANPQATVAIHKSTVSEYRLKLTSSAYNSDGAFLGIGFGFSNNYLKAAILAEAKDANARTNLHFALNGAATSANASLADSKMVVTHTGNVGIGTTTPAQKLDIVGKVRITDDLILAQVSGRIDYDNGSTGSLRFFSTSTATERMRITSTGLVGIGTSAPAYLLHTQAAQASNSALVYIKNTSAGRPAYVGFTSLTKNFTAGVKDDIGFVIGTGDGIIAADADIAITINTSRNLGIGTTSPDANLTVNGAASFAAGTALLPSIARSGDLNTGFWFPAADTLAASTAGSERIRITSAGLVGIGTASPTNRLSVSGNVNATGNISFGNTGSPLTTLTGILSEDRGFSISAANASTVFITSNQGPVSVNLRDIGVAGSNIVFGTGSSAGTSFTERMKITDAGNVGIATTTPAAKLSVDGSAIFNDSGADVDFRVEGDTDANLLFVDASTDRIGVGEAAPDYKLDVNGTFGFTPGASVTPADNGDVVFELTNNTTLTVKAKGSDGVVRSGTITLA